MDDLAKLLVQVLKAMPSELMLVDTDGRVLAVSNSCLQNVMKRERYQVAGQLLPIALGFSEHIGSVDGLAELAAVQAALEYPIMSKLKLHLPDGNRPWEVQVQPVFNEDGTQSAALLIFSRYNQELLAEGERLLTRQGLENRLAYAEDLLHTVKNNLQSMSGVVQIIGEKCKKHNIVIDTLDLVREDIAATMFELLEFSRADNGDSQYGKFSLNQVVDEAVKRLHTQFVANRIELQTDLLADMPTIWLDKKRIRDVLINCLNNSCEAILQAGQKAGLVTLKTQLDEAQDVVRVVIEDNGIGLTPEQQENFFKPYYTTKEHGTGIGMSISQVAVVMHGGRILASGQPNAGCRVCIELPLNNTQIFENDDYLATVAQLKKQL